jgi:hypothetical protein
LSPAAGAAGSTLLDLVSSVVTHRVDLLLEVLSDLPAPLVRMTLQQLDREGALNALAMALGAEHATRHPAAVVRILALRSGPDSEELYRVASRTLELAGRDPDEVAGTYRTRQEFQHTFKEELALRDQKGGYQLSKDGKSLKTGTFAGAKGYRLGLTPNSCVAAVLIRLHPSRKIPASAVSALKARWRDGIGQVWNSRFVADDGKGRCLDLVMRPLFVDSEHPDPVHFDVEIRPTGGRSDETSWDVEDEGPKTAAHEFGHMLGAPDEYDLPVRDGDGKVIDAHTDPNSIMASFGRAQERHLIHVVTDLNTLLGNPSPPMVAKPKGAARKDQTSRTPRESK